MSGESNIIESSELKTCKRPVNFDDVVLKALFERMDPATRTVAPQWRTLASALGVCTVTLGKYIHQLKENGRIVVITSDGREEQTGENQGGGHPAPTWLPNLRKRYFINESVDADWAASVVPQFERAFVANAKHRCKSTKAQLDAEADVRFAERCRLVMEDFVSRMNPVTRSVAPKTKGLSQRIGRNLNPAEYARVVRAFKAAGLVEARRLHDASSGDRTGDYVFILDTDAIAKLDYLELAKTHRLKTVRSDGDARRNSSFRDELGERIFAWLRERMSPETHLVKASMSEIGKALGCFQRTVSNAMRRLVAEKRLVKIVGKARRGMGNGATVYRVIVSAEERVAPRAVSPAATHAATEIFTALSLENFKTSGRREIDFDRISIVNGKAGIDRSQVFDAMRILRGIAQGRDVSAFPALWFGSDWPTKLSISFSAQENCKLTYSVTLQRIDDNRVRVADERLASGRDDLLVRRKHFYTHIATKEKCGIGMASFALHDAVKSLSADDPVAQFARRLGNLWLLNPDPNAMKSEIGFGVVNADAGDFADFATCMVVQQKQAAVATAMRDAVLRLCPGVTGYTVERNPKGVPYLAVRHGGDLDPKGSPFALLDNAEKMLFLIAFVCAMNRQSSHAPVVWLSPFNWLGERERADAASLVRSSFSTFGQLILLG